MHPIPQKRAVRSTASEDRMYGQRIELRTRRSTARALRGIAYCVSYPCPAMSAASKSRAHTSSDVAQPAHHSRTSFSTSTGQSQSSVLPAVAARASPLQPARLPTGEPAALSPEGVAATAEARLVGFAAPPSPPTAPRDSRAFAARCVAAAQRHAASAASCSARAAATAVAPCSCGASSARQRNSDGSSQTSPVYGASTGGASPPAATACWATSNQGAAAARNVARSAAAAGGSAAARRSASRRSQCRAEAVSARAASARPATRPACRGGVCTRSSLWTRTAIRA